MSKFICDYDFFRRPLETPVLENSKTLVKPEKRFTTLFILLGNPIPLARPRFSRSGASRVYDKQKTIKIKTAFELRDQINQSNDLTMFSGPLNLDITFFMKIPKTSKRKTKLLINQYHHKKPDLSNLVKFVEDVASGIIYKDDALIAKINATKVYDLKPRTEFTVTLLGESYENSRVENTSVEKKESPSR